MRPLFRTKMRIVQELGIIRMGCIVIHVRRDRLNDADAKRTIPCVAVLGGRRGFLFQEWQL